MKKIFSVLAALTLISTFKEDVSAQCTPGGNPSVFGDHAWNVYAWNSGGTFDDGHSWNDNYSGYYVDTNLNYNSFWDPWESPSHVPGYLGCEVEGENHSWSAKRQGFSCGYYRIDVTAHDDEGQLFVDGVKVWEDEGCCDSHSNIWTGILTDSSTLEFRVTEGIGQSFGAINITPAVITASGPTTFCPGYSVDLTAVPSDSYLWSTGETTSSISVTESGTFSVTVPLPGGCIFTSSQDVIVQPFPKPIITVYGMNPYSNCGFVPQLGISNFSNLYTYDWGNGMLGNVITPPGPGTYTVTARDILGCASASVPFDLTTTESIDSTVFGNHQWGVHVHQDYIPETIGCDGYCNLPAVPYAYKGSLTVSGLNFNAADHWNVLSNPSIAANYHGCDVTDDHFHISAMRKGFDCGMYQVNIPAHNDDAYLYVNGTLVWSESGIGVSIDSVWSGLLNEDSKIEFKVFELEGENKASIDVMPVQLFTTVTPIISGPAAVCGTNSITLDAGTGFSSYAWSNGSTTQTTSVNAAGNYSVKVTDVNGCVSTSQATITAAKQFTYYADTDGDTYGNPSASVMDCTQPSGYVIDNTDCNDANGSVHPGAADVCNSIDDNCNGVIDENAITGTVSPSGLAVFCQGGSVTLTANSGAGISYQWQKNTKNLVGATNQTYVVNATGNYRVKETNSFSCASTSAFTSVSKSSYPTATITALGNLNICHTGSVVLQANSGAGYTYQWLKGGNNIAGATQQTYTATTTGIYKVTVTNSSGCSKGSKNVKVTKSCKMDFDDQAVNVASLSIFPNPSDGNFTVSLYLEEETNQQATVQVFNCIGQIVQQQMTFIENGNLNEEIHLGKDVSHGIYIVQVITHDQRFSSRIVIGQ